jgi:hypothetical protein
MTHIYEWLDDNEENKEVEKLWKYLDFRTRSVSWQYDNKNLEPKYSCICDYKGKEYKITGASRLGDVWLHNDLRAEHGYVARVDIDDCSNFKYIDKPKLDMKNRHWLKNKNNDNKSRSKNKNNSYPMYSSNADSYHSQTGKYNKKK